MDFKFPHTPHLAWLGSTSPRLDKVLAPSEVKNFLAQSVVVEEKIDGANIGISFNPSGQPIVKNRGTLLGPGGHPQFQPLWPWLAQRQNVLFDALGEHLMLFGEWCFAVHSLRYLRLPDLFIAFDVFDTQQDRFWSSSRRNSLAQTLSLATAPSVAQGRFSLPQLEQTLASLTSAFGDQPAEGLYIRQEDNDWLRRRAKLVRPEFIQAIEEHWSSRPLERNLIHRSHL